MDNIIYIIWIHFFADFLAQTPTMVEKKIELYRWMTLHCVVYALFFVYFAGWRGAVIIGVTHFMVDVFAARAVDAAHNKGQRTLANMLLGLDQAIHLTVLAILLYK